MNIALWIVQWILAVMFMMVGMMKLMQPKEKMAEKMGWVEDFSQQRIRGIGFLEVMGALGVVLPGLTGIAPFLTAWAAAGLALTMVGALMTHIRRKEIVPMGVMNMMLFALAAFVAFGRF
jgi:uncharacterized membrane protein YphA (DoxX/SURF4 family)